MRSSLVPSELELETNNTAVTAAPQPTATAPAVAAGQQKASIKSKAPHEPCPMHEASEKVSKVLIAGQEVSSEPMPTSEPAVLDTKAAGKVAAGNNGQQQSSVVPLVVNPPPGFGDSPVKMKLLFEQQQQEQQQPELQQQQQQEIQHECNRSTESLDRGAHKHHGGRPRKSSSTASSVVTSAHHTHPGSVSCSTVSLASGTGTLGKSRSRSRSSSKERLLSKLADACNAPNTPLDEDEVMGKFGLKHCQNCRSTDFEALKLPKVRSGR